MITADDFTAALAELGVSPEDTIFVHSDLLRALRAEGATARDKMDTILSGFESAVPAGTLILPTFTYSFCDGEDFDIAASPSKVGALTEHFRARPGVRRTAEPIFSSAVLGPLPAATEAGLFAVGDTECFGSASVFAHLLAADAKLVFFGVGFEFCTFVHHVEQTLGVPYRYLKDFSGDVVTGGGRTATTASFYVRDLDAGIETDFSRLEAALAADGRIKDLTMEAGPRLQLVTAADVAAAAERGLRDDPGFLIAPRDRAGSLGS